MATMDRSTPESYSDGDDSEPISRRGGKRSSRGASDGGAAAPYAVPLVIRTAAAAARSTPTTRTPGYSPKLSMDMASAHSWAPYTAVIPALRSLSLKSLNRGPGADLELEAAKELIAGLYSHAAPFAAARRFPEGEVYVCLDRAPFASSMQWIQQHLMRAEVSYGDDLTRACAGYASGIGSALDDLTRVDDRHRGGAPVLYDRAAFESAFLLTWTQP